LDTEASILQSEKEPGMNVNEIRRRAMTLAAGPVGRRAVAGGLAAVLAAAQGIETLTQARKHDGKHGHHRNAHDNNHGRNHDDHGRGQNGRYADHKNDHNDHRARDNHQHNHDGHHRAAAPNQDQGDAAGGDNVQDSGWPIVVQAPGDTTPGVDSAPRAHSHDMDFAS
jgi:hypothetical protein